MFAAGLAFAAAGRFAAEAGAAGRFAVVADVLPATGALLDAVLGAAFAAAGVADVLAFAFAGRAGRAPLSSFGLSTTFFAR